MSTIDVGNRAEMATAAYLAARGFEIIERNFRTPRCEIDVVAKKKDCIYFVEVKYRSNDRQGTGLDYITTTKQKHMQYAAEVWMQQHDWRGEAVLSAAEVDQDLRVTEFIESIA